MFIVVRDIIIESWEIINDASIYILFGFFIAGIIHVFISPRKIVKYLGRGDLTSVIYASLFGIPIPLCSCGVVPTAISLRKNGASKGATISFLISTPESGVDSIAISYAMLDIIMTIFRPISAFITATIAGGLTNLFTIDESEEYSWKPDGPDCCRLKRCKFSGGDNHRHTMKEKIIAGIEYGFVDLLSDVSKWLIIGTLIAGVISYIIPDGFFENYIGSGISSMIIALIVGIPLYICATASTPVAAAMISKGLNPGAAMVFLLSGPATNAATLAVITKFIGKRGTLIYLLSIGGCSIILGFILNLIYRWYVFVPSPIIGRAGELLPYSLKVILSILLILLMLNGLWHEYRERSPS